MIKQKGSMGTTVRCPDCKYENLAIDIWCARCGTPVDWDGTRSPVAKNGNRAKPEARHGWPSGLAALAEGLPWRKAPEPVPVATPASAAPLATKPQAPEPVQEAPPAPTPTRAVARAIIRRPRIEVPRVTLPRVTLPQFRMPRIPKVGWAVAAVVAVLILAPLAYVLSPAGRHLVAARSSTPPKLTTTGSPPTPSSSALAAAIPGVEAETSLKYVTGSCPASGSCLKFASQASGLNAAAVQFTTARTGGRQCIGYVFHNASGWHFLNATCAVPGQVSPLVGNPATVHVPGQCANLRDAAGLAGSVVVCLKDGTVVRVDGGPNYADGKLWWHLDKNGWMAHDFLIGA